MSYDIEKIKKPSYNLTTVGLSNDSNSNIPTAAAGLSNNSNNNSNIPTTAAASGVETIEIIEPIIEPEYDNFPPFPMNSSDFSTCPDGNYSTNSGHILVIKNGIASVDGIIIANKTFSLPSDFVPTNVDKDVSYSNEISVLEDDAARAFEEMVMAAQKAKDENGESLDLFIKSGYRSYSCQEGLYYDYAAVDGIEKADTYSARPGHSEHQTGLAIDINMASEDFTDTAEAKWLNDHAAEYGFILRYPEGKSDITGYKYESWHYRYVGEELAKELYNNGNWITLEEYFGLNSVY